MKSIELFAGIGGIALAAEWAGIETVAFCEREPFCQKVLKKHWPDVPIFDDIRTLNKQSLKEGGVDVGSIELISGGFPCQPFSVAGQRKGKEDDRDLWPEMFRIIEELRPTWVVGENVANFVNMELDRTLSDLESIGYEGQSFVIPACAVDAKHRRDRTFVVAYSDSRRRLEHEGQPQKIQSRGDEGFQRKESQQSLLQQSLYGSDGIMANTSFIGLEKEGAEFETTRSTGVSENVPNSTVKGLERDSRGISKGSGPTRTSRWAVEPNVGRVANGVSNRVDRIKSLGNAVVPQQIYPIFKSIMEIGT